MGILPWLRKEKLPQTDEGKRLLDYLGRFRKELRRVSVESDEFKKHIVDLTSAGQKHLQSEIKKSNNKKFKEFLEECVEVVYVSRVVDIRNLSREPVKRLKFVRQLERDVDRLSEKLIAHF